MRVLVCRLAALLCVALAACQTDSYRQTEQLAGTSWRMTSTPPAEYAGLRDLQFGTKLSPAGLGQVQLDAGQAFYQVIDGKLVLRFQYLAQNHTFDFKLDADRLILTPVAPDGSPGKPDLEYRRVKAGV